MIQNGELFVIHELHQQGLSISAIPRQTGLDRKTVRKYLQQGLTTPRYGPRAPRPQLLDAYRGYLRERIQAYPTMRGTRLLREIRALGYAGGYTQLTAYLREIRPVAESGFEHRFETIAPVASQTASQRIPHDTERTHCSQERTRSLTDRDGSGIGRELQHV